MVEASDLTEAIEDGFRQDTAEKVYRLLDVLRELQARKSTRDRFALKGGTALNVFHLPGVPRLSVDIDIVTVGYPDAAPHTSERETAFRDVIGVVEDQKYKTGINDSGDSGITIHCTYRNLLGSQDNLKIDMDYVNRQLILPPEPMAGPELLVADDVSFPMVSRPELCAQKLVAVAYRASARDLYDMHRMLDEGWHLDAATRRLYLAVSFLKDHDWHRLDYPTKLNVDYKPDILQDVLRGNQVAPDLEALRTQAMDALHPDFVMPTERERDSHEQLLEQNARAFADLLQETGAQRIDYLANLPSLAFRLSQITRK